MAEQGIARLVSLLSSADPADVPGVISLIPEPALAEGLADPASEVCVVAAEHVMQTGSARLAMILSERIANHDPLVSATGQINTLNWILRERGLTGFPVRPRAWPGRPGFGSEPMQKAEDLRLAMLRQLERGTLRGVGLITQTAPAVATVALAGHDHVPPPGVEPVDRARWGRADAARALRRLVDERLGTDLDAWRRMLSRLDVHPGSFSALLDSPPPGSLPREVPYWQGMWTVDTAASVLLAMAPPGVAQWALTDQTLQVHSPFDIARAMMAVPPLTRVTVDQVLRNGLPIELRRLAANPATPDSVQRRILRIPQLPEDVIGRIYANGDERLRRDLVQGGLLNPAIFGAMLPDLPHAAVFSVLASEDAAWLHAVVRAANTRLSPEMRLRFYGRLAELAGPEPVWALEIARAGSVRDAARPVRASMIASSLQPIVEAAAALPEPSEDPASAILRNRREALLDDPVGWPLEDLVHEHLDGRPERWRVLIRLLLTGADEPLEDLIPVAAARAG